MLIKWKVEFRLEMGVMRGFEKHLGQNRKHSHIYKNYPSVSKEEFLKVAAHKKKLGAV